MRRGALQQLAGTVWPGLGPAFEGRAREVELERLRSERASVEQQELPPVEPGTFRYDAYEIREELGAADRGTPAPAQRA